MTSKSIFSFLILTLPALAQVTRINWEPCELDSQLPTFCANLSVPLDYANVDSNATIQVALAKIPASKSPSRGSILLNFGGPGSEARHTLAGLATVFQASVLLANSIYSFNERY
jgi:hypothetical protein